MKRTVKTAKKIMAAVPVIALSVALAACGQEQPADNGDDYDVIADDFDDEDDQSEAAGDIDLDALNDSVNSIKNLDLTSDLNADADDQDADALTEDADAPGDDADAGEPKGDLTMYSYTDVYRDGNDLTIISNGGLDSSTALFNDKKLGDFLDYVDSTVLEPGRTINRDLFYDMLAIMLVDKDLASSQTYIEKNLMMALTVSNDFHDTDVKIENCHLDANNAAEYKYKVKAEGKDDTWIVNYQNRSFYMNDGATEYTSDMFSDNTLAVWMVAIEEYYGITG